MNKEKTDAEIRMFAIEQMATVFKGYACIPYHFLPCAELIAKYIKTGEYPKEPNEEGQSER